MKKKINHKSIRPFLMFWGSQSVSAMGTAMTDYALVIWVYGQTGTASALSLMTLCSFLPTILFRFLAGAVADRWNKKRIMLISDFTAALGTCAVLALYGTEALSYVHLYVINFLLSLMNAFQVPASYVATSLLIPRDQYARAEGLQAMSGALISILSPVLGAVVLSWGGMEWVLVIDLATFAIAFLTLMFIRIPNTEKRGEVGESFVQTCLSGLRYLKEHPVIMRLIVFIAFVNFLAKLGPDGQMAAFILSRTGGDRAVLSAVQSAVALGLLAGGALTAAVKPSGQHVKMIYGTCLFIFLTGMVLALGRSPVVWCISAFLQYLFAAVMNVHWNTLMRSEVPTDMQGRVFSARDTLQNITIPIGIYLGGSLCDYAFEPMMAGDNPVMHMLSPVFGSGSGAGIAVMFFLVSASGFLVSMIMMRRAHSCKRSSEK